MLASPPRPPHPYGAHICPIVDVVLELLTMPHTRSPLHTVINSNPSVVLKRLPDFLYGGLLTTPCSIIHFADGDAAVPDKDLKVQPPQYVYVPTGDATNQAYRYLVCLIVSMPLCVVSMTLSVLTAPPPPCCRPPSPLPPTDSLPSFVRPCLDV